MKEALPRLRSEDPAERVLAAVEDAGAGFDAAELDSVSHALPVDLEHEEPHDRRAVLDALLAKYADSGLKSVESLEILKVDPLTAFGTPMEIVKLFGGKPAYLAAIRELTEYFRPLLAKRRANPGDDLVSAIATPCSSASSFSEATVDSSRAAQRTSPSPASVKASE